jgi:hypothetical protein
MTRGHSKKIFKKHSSIRERSHFFIQCVTNLRNQLSENTGAADSMGAFKRTVDKQWLKQKFLYNWEAIESSTLM